MYFLVNETANFADALVRSKAGFCDGVSSTEV